MRYLTRHCWEKFDARNALGRTQPSSSCIFFFNAILVWLLGDHTIFFNTSLWLASGVLPIFPHVSSSSPPSLHQYMTLVCVDGSFVRLNASFQFVPIVRNGRKLEPQYYTVISIPSFLPFFSFFQRFVTNNKTSIVYFFHS